MRVLEEAVERTEPRLMAYCVLPNHRYLVVWLLNSRTVPDTFLVPAPVSGRRTAVDSETFRLAL